MTQKANKTEPVRLALPVYCNSDYYADIDACYIEVTEELVGLIESRMRTARHLKSDDREFYCLHFWDGSPVWFRADEDGVEEVFELSPGLPVEGERVEVVQMRVTENDICWQCIVKYTDIILESESLSLEELKMWAK